MLKNKVLLIFIILMSSSLIQSMRQEVRDLVVLRMALENVRSLLKSRYEGLVLADSLGMQPALSSNNQQMQLADGQKDTLTIPHQIAVFKSISIGQESEIMSDFTLYSNYKRTLLPLLDLRHQ